MRQLTLKGRGSVSRLNGAYLRPKESDSMEKTKCEKSRSTSSQGLLEVDEREGRLRKTGSVHRASVRVSLK